MADAHSYLHTLNSLAVGQAREQTLFDAWAEATREAQFAQTLRFVAIRAGAHAAAFRKRLCELGWTVHDDVDSDFAERLSTARSDAADASKFAALVRDDDDGLTRLFDDATIDPTTGALLGRFIAEARDSRRRLRAERDRLDRSACDHLDRSDGERIDRSVGEPDRSVGEPDRFAREHREHDGFDDGALADVVQRIERLQSMVATLRTQRRNGQRR